MRVLVTGAKGFVGTNLVEYLKEKQIEVVGLDKRPGTDIQYRLGSMGNPPSLAGVEVIIHLASQSHVDKSITGPVKFLQDNVDGTLELFEICRNDPDIKQIILFSTDEVGACLETGSFKEEFRFDTGSTYSATKGAQELLAQAYIKTFHLPIIITRCVNIFGPYQADEKFIPTVCRYALADQGVPIYGSGLQQRQWVHVSHVCDVLNYLCVYQFFPPKTILHITGTKEIYNILLARTILNLLGKFPDLITHVPDRLGHDLRYSMERTDKTNNFGLPEYDESGFMNDLERTVRFYEELYGRRS
jgi:dTDP-glucose 4,6-dehydratase